jgi:hypothetical protein
VTDTTPAILILFGLFICPKKNIFKGFYRFFCLYFHLIWLISINFNQGESYEHLITWKNLQEIFPWSVILLIGGGLAIAEGFSVSRKRIKYFSQVK